MRVITHLSNSTILMSHMFGQWSEGFIKYIFIEFNGSFVEVMSRRVQKQSRIPESLRLFRLFKIMFVFCTIVTMN